MTKKLETLIEDIEALFVNGKDVSETNLEIFAENLKDLLRDRLASYKQERRGSLRMSSVGKPLRQVWYEVHGAPGESLKPNTLLKFLYGDLIEELVLFLAREAGHQVTDQQATVDLDGVKGHIDAVIDGVVVDVKSTSSYAFKKFKYGTLHEDDPFGYMKQLAGYSAALKMDGAFLAMDKSSGNLALLQFDRASLEMEHPQNRIEDQREALTKDTPPERCYGDTANDKSGNRKLVVGCSYCRFKHHCWADANDGEGLRTFLYSNGPAFFTHVEKTPKVPEITPKKGTEE